MKTKPPTPTAKIELTKDILLDLGTILAQLDVEVMLADTMDARDMRSVKAGIVATLQTILPEKQFHQVMVQWEIDGFQVAEFLALAKVKPTTTIET